MSADRWISVPTVSGHYGPVQDISWEPTHGAYLLSVSADQTTRAYAPCLEEGEKESRDTRWCEIARPQIHGYDIQCVCTLSPVLFISAADEKVRLLNTHCPAYSLQHRTKKRPFSSLSPKHLAWELSLVSRRPNFSGMIYLAGSSSVSLSQKFHWQPLEYQ